MLITKDKLKELGMKKLKLFPEFEKVKRMLKGGLNQA